MQMINNTTVIAVISALLFIISILLIIKNRYSLKKIISLTLMLFMLGYFIVSNLNVIIIRNQPTEIYKLFSLFPFGNFIYTHIDDMEIRALYQTLFNKYFILCFILSLIWGICLPTISSKSSLKKTLICAGFVLFPINIILMCFCYFGYSIETVFDTGSYIIIIVGIVIGWNIYDSITISRNRKDKKI